jgi:transcription elongation factor GreA
MRKATQRRTFVMNTTKDIFLSKKGMKELKKQIGHLEHDLKNALLSLRELDKTEAHEERLARIEKLAYIDVIESELADKRMALANAKLLPRKRDAFKVAIGSVVDLIDTSGRMVRYTLVDSIEANPSDGRISIKSPLGKNLLGRQIQDMVEWSAGLRTNQMRLVGIG